MQGTVTKSELIESISEQLKLPTGKAEQIVNCVFDSMVKALQEGEGIEIGFNAAYLLEVLKYMSTDEKKITLKAPERAATIEPVPAEGEEAEDYLCLVMPLRLLD